MLADGSTTEVAVLMLLSPVIDAIAFTRRFVLACVLVSTLVVLAKVVAWLVALVGGSIKISFDVSVPVKPTSVT